MSNTQGFNPETGEWNDNLTGDFVWSNANIGEALSGKGASGEPGEESRCTP